jgi:hypothetical protein
MNTTISGMSDRRFRADFPPGTVVFLIGMRVNRWRSVRSWLPAFKAMPAMLRELYTHPELGFLDASSWWAGRNIMTVQYWRSMDDLMRYATGKDGEHFPAWQRYMKAASSSNATGVWHEAYEVHPGTSHMIYVNMPPMLMGKATSWRSAKQMPPQSVQRKPVGLLYGKQAG